MGASTSTTRKLTVENDDPTSVIKVSEQVVDRIKGSSVTHNKETTPVKVLPQQDNQIPLFRNESNLTSYQIRQATANELTKNDDYWKERIYKLEEKHKKMHEIMDEEYKKAVNEMNKKQQVAVNKKLPECEATERAVKDCYVEYRNESMKCEKVVQAFQECVDLKRNTLLSSRG